MTFDAPLPGFAPDHTVIHLERRPDGGWDLRVAHTDGPGFVTAADFTTYELDQGGEVLDVLGAIVDALVWS